MQSWGHSYTGYAIKLKDNIYGILPIDFATEKVVFKFSNFKQFNNHHEKILIPSYIDFSSIN